AVVDRQNDGAIVRLERDTGGPAVVERVVEQIRDDAPQREPVAEYDRAAGRQSRVELDRSAFGAPVVDLGANDLVELDELLRELACAGTRREQRIVEETHHVLDVGDGAFPLGVVRYRVDAQPEPRRERAYVVRDSREHRDA